VEGTSPPARDSRRRRFRIAIVLVSVAVAVVGSVLLATRDSSGNTTTRGVTATLRVPGHPRSVAAGPDALWVALHGGDGRLVRLDLATRAQAQSVYLGGEVSHLARLGDDRLIASIQHASGLGELAVLKWRSGAVLARRWFDPPVDQTVVRGSDLWALEARPGAQLLRLDSKTLEPTSAPLPVSPGRTLALASGGGYLWVTAADAGEVLRIDPTTHAIKRVNVGGLPIGIVVTGGSVWFADHDGGKVVRLDPRSLLPVGKPIGVGRKPSGLAAAAGSVFVTNEEEGTVVRIDAHTGKRIGLPIRIAPPTRDVPAPAVARAGQSVWVSSFASNTLNRIDSTAGRRGGEIKVVIAHDNDRHQGDRAKNTAGIGVFTASGAISDKGKSLTIRTEKLPLITIRYVTSGRRGTITYLVKIDTEAGTARWTITSATKAYEGLHGEGTEKENADFTVHTLTGTVTG
jgi:hypothetical protein